MTYREEIYKKCTETDLDDKEAITMLVQELAHDAVMYSDIIKKYEKKLQDVLTYTEFEKFTTDVAQEIFKNDVAGMADSEFKDFIVEHMDEILDWGGEQQWESR